MDIIIDHKNRYLNSAELLDIVFDIYKKSFFKQIIYSIFTSAIIYGILGIAYYLYNYYTRDVVLDFGEGIIFIFLVMFVAIPLVFTLWFTLNQTGNMFLAKQAYFDEDINLVLAIKNTFKNMFRVFTVGVVKIIISTGLFTAIIYVWFLFQMIISIGTVPLLTRNLNSIIPIIFIMIVLALTGVFFYLAFDVMFVVSTPVAIFEKKYFLKPIGKSYQLIMKSYWKNCGSYIGILIITKIIQYSLMLAFVFLKAFPTKLINVDIFYSFGFTVSLIIVAIINIVINPIIPIYSTVTYFNEKIKSDGLDIRLKLKKLSEENF